MLFMTILYTSMQTDMMAVMKDRQLRKKNGVEVGEVERAITIDDDEEDDVTMTGNDEDGREVSLD